MNWWNSRGYWGTIIREESLYYVPGWRVYWCWQQGNNAGFCAIYFFRRMCMRICYVHFCGQPTPQGTIQFVLLHAWTEQLPWLDSLLVSVSSVQLSRLVVSNSLWPHGLQHARPPCPSPTSGTCSNSCPLSWWCHPTISSSVISFSSHLQSFPASGSFPMSQFFTSGHQSIGVSASAPVLHYLGHRDCLWMWVYVLGYPYRNVD